MALKGQPSNHWNSVGGNGSGHTRSHSANHVLPPNVTATGARDGWTGGGGGGGHQHARSHSVNEIKLNGIKKGESNEKP